MEAAQATARRPERIWSREDITAYVVATVVETGRQPHGVIDELCPIRLEPEDEKQAIRDGVLSWANDRRGMRGFRSGRVQSVRSGPQPLAEEATAMEDFAIRTLLKLVFKTASGESRSVLDFTKEDAAFNYEDRVRAARERANREEPFWLALMEATEKGPLRKRPRKVVARVAKLALVAKLTADDRRDLPEVGQGEAAD